MRVKKINLYIKKRLLVFVLLTCLNTPFAISQPKESLPNVILILMDDLGYGDLSCYGALDIRTPHLDQLANEGIRFINYLSPQAVCSASRAALLTGCYANRVGISGALFPNAGVGLAQSEVTIAEMMKQKNMQQLFSANGTWATGTWPPPCQCTPATAASPNHSGIPMAACCSPIREPGSSKIFGAAMIA